MLEGGCLCGAVRIQSTGQILNKVYTARRGSLDAPRFILSYATAAATAAANIPFQALCHCLDCRKITGSTHSTNVLVPKDGFTVTKGSPKEFNKKADSGNVVTLFFCGDCGSTLWSQTPAYGETRVIKAGTLDSDEALEDAKPPLELFVKNRPSWLPTITGAVQHETSL